MHSPPTPLSSAIQLIVGVYWSFQPSSLGSHKQHYHHHHHSHQGHYHHRLDNIDDDGVLSWARIYGQNLIEFWLAGWLACLLYDCSINNIKSGLGLLRGGEKKKDHHIQHSFIETDLVHHRHDHLRLAKVNQASVADHHNVALPHRGLHVLLQYFPFDQSH